MAVPETATAHQAEQKALAKRVAADAYALWATMDPAYLDLSWARMADRMLALLVGAQYLAASQADPYVTQVLAEQGVDPSGDGMLQPQRFAGVASDGRDLSSLLYEPVIATKAAIGAGTAVESALSGGLLLLDMIMRTQVADAGRVAVGAALVARPAAGGYVRMVVGKTCSRCIVLAGKWYGWNAGFDRHPRCFPAGVTVSGPANLAASRRPYQGELVVIRTASGQELPTTGNHPVLTDRGWLPANLIQEGDHVVRSTRSQGATALVVPNEDQVPALIEDCWRPDGVVPLLHMPTTAQDFHGDGGYGHVDVVLANRLLGHDVKSTTGKLAQQEEFSRRVTQPLGFPGRSSAQQGFHGLPGSTHSVMGGSGLLLPFAGGHAAGAHFARLGHAAYLNASTDKTRADDVAGYPVAQAEAVFALPGAVGAGDVVDRERDLAPRWDAPPGPFTVESRAAYSEVGQDLRLRLASQVELDRVVQVSRIEWSGHVYNLTSSEGWYSANGLIVSNCDCVHIPSRENISGDIRTDPREVFNSMTRAEQDKAFTKAGAEAIREGADIGQVVNARSGMSAAGTTKTGVNASGRVVNINRRTLTGPTTKAGTTHRGLAGQRLGAVRGGPRVTRLTPERIYETAGTDRDEALRLLHEHGYLVARPNVAARIAPLSPARAQRMQDAMLHDAPWAASQREALLEYTGGWAGAVNGTLRYGQDHGYYGDLFTKGVFAGMRPLPETITVHRFVGVDAFGVRDVSKLAKLVGTTMQDRGFLSTSIASSGWASEEMARAARRQVRMEIVAGPGTPAAYVESLSAHPGQWEVILGAGTKFRIVSVVVDGRTAVVRVRVVP